MLLLLPLATPCLRRVRNDRDRQILALRQQVLILHRQLGKRARLNRTDKFALLLVCARMKQHQLLDLPPRNRSRCYVGM